MRAKSHPAINRFFPLCFLFFPRADIARCCLDAMKLPSMRKAIEFASFFFSGRTVCAYGPVDDAIVMEAESVHGGPRIGEPGAEREVLL